jgi:glycerol-3-phosphate acyltransferase PlsY
VTGLPAIPLALAFLLGYALGSIPFGLLLTRWAGLGDVRAIGSGNIGATNVLRTGRKGLAAATLLLDALKATLAILIAGRLFGPDAQLAAAFGAFVGHIAPVWLGFRGGKGVATFIGCALALQPLAVLAFAAVWLSVAYATRYSSAAALAASLATPLAAWLLGSGASALLMSVLAALLWVKHAENIARLRAGTEGRIGAKG